jgi:sugar O-acyltransferase (sialic acid O-acetyltransferase NeuD family)
MGALLIIGAGGHGKVVAEAAELDGRFENIMFLDDRIDAVRVLGHVIIGKLQEYEKFAKQYEYAIVCIGVNEKRVEITQKLLKAGYKVPVIIHPKASVSKYSDIGDGSVILAGAVVNTNANIGMACIININSSVDHESIIGDGVHICSGAVVRSGCRVGELSCIGAGAVVNSGIILKEKSMVQSGMVI